MEKEKTILKVLAVLLALFPLLSCNPLENRTQSNSMIIIENISGLDAEGNTSNFIQSDVQKIDTDTGLPIVTADIATARLRAELLDPDPILGNSQYNDVQITRYVVRYTRSDGKNIEGVDVPYSFEGYLSALIKVGEPATVNFVIVREVAKVEPPLVSLVENRSEGVLQVIATIDFYGHDLSEREVTASGAISIFFANYAD
jgi:hypothetical protein